MSDVDLAERRQRVRVRERVRIPVRRRRHYGRWIGLGVLGVLLLIGLLVGLSALPAKQARDHLLQGKAALERARAELLGGHVEEASADFREASSKFIQASSDARSPLLRIGGWIPVLGRTPDTVTVLADAGGLVARAGGELADAIAALPGGAGALAPRDGGIPLRPLVALRPAISQGRFLVHAATTSVQDTSGGLLLGPVGDAREQALTQLAALEQSFDAANVLAQRLPAFLGQSGPKRYFFGAQNPAELRGTGGFIGAYAILTIDHGRLAFSPFRPIQSLPEFPASQVAPPSKDYASNYDTFGGAGFWPNINMTPDFPSAALAMEHLYAKGTGRRLDGVIVADPFSLRSLLEETGPVQTPGLGVTLDQGNVVPFTTNQAYTRFTDPDTRKVLLGEAAKAVFLRFMRGGVSAESLGSALVRTVADGHLLVYSNDAALEHGLVRAGGAGALATGPGDFLSVVQDNGGANKVDYYLDRTVTYSVQLGASGSGSATADIRLANKAPKAGQPQYVIGPFHGVARPGENATFVNLYCTRTCDLRQHTLNGVDAALRPGQERGLPYYQSYVRIPSGHTADLRYSMSIAHAWDGDDGSGTYRLTFLNQATIRPTHVRVEIQAPAGMSIGSTNVPMQVAGDRAVWEGTPGARLTLEVHFGRSLPARTWHSIVDFLTKPLF